MPTHCSCLLSVRTAWFSVLNIAISKTLYKVCVAGKRITVKNSQHFSFELRHPFSASEDLTWSIMYFPNAQWKVCVWENTMTLKRYLQTELRFGEYVIGRSRCTVYIFLKIGWRVRIFNWFLKYFVTDCTGAFNKDKWQSTCKNYWGDITIC